MREHDQAKAEANELQAQYERTIADLQSQLGEAGNIARELNAVAEQATAVSNRAAESLTIAKENISQLQQENNQLNQIITREENSHKSTKEKLAAAKQTIADLQNQLAAKQADDSETSEESSASEISAHQKNDSQIFRNALKTPLLNAIAQMEAHGLKLSKMKHPKGEVITALAQKLTADTEAFFKKDMRTMIAELDTFKEQVLTDINDKKISQGLGQYRAKWQTIVANIGIALTGIGALFIGGKLIYSAIKHHRGLFLFSKPVTGSEKKVNNLKHELTKLQLAL
jgi:hypothetical protein